jgi:glycosyltransferase involved in cell wall biosynthesis
VYSVPTAIQLELKKMINYTPKVTVIITCFNREESIAQSIESVINQTYKNIELIIIDDCSTDHSQSIISDFANTEAGNIKFLKNASNCGQNASINRAFLNSTGDYFAFLDSDDEYETHFVSTMLNSLLNNPDYNFSYCRMVKGPKWRIEGCNQYSQVLRKGSLCNLGSLFLTKKAMSSIAPLPERLIPNDNCQDDAICFELSKRYCFIHVKEELYIKKSSKQQITHDTHANLLAWITLYSLYRDEILESTGFFNWIRLHAKLTVSHDKSRVLILLALEEHSKSNRFELARTILYSGLVAYFYLKHLSKRVLHKFLLILANLRS